MYALHIFTTSSLSCLLYSNHVHLYIFTGKYILQTIIIISIAKLNIDNCLTLNLTLGTVTQHRPNIPNSHFSSHPISFHPILSAHPNPGSPHLLIKQVNLHSYIHNKKPLTNPLTEYLQSDTPKNDLYKSQFKFQLQINSDPNSSLRFRYYFQCYHFYSGLHSQFCPKKQ